MVGALTRPDVLALCVLAAVLFGGRALGALFPGQAWLRRFEPAPPAAPQLLASARRASWRRTGAQLAAGAVLLPALTILVSPFNPLTGWRLVLAVAVPIALAGLALACFAAVRRA